VSCNAGIGIHLLPLRKENDGTSHRHLPPIFSNTLLRKIVRYVLQATDTLGTSSGLSMNEKE